MRTWLAERLKASGKSQAALARHLRRGNDWVSLLLNRKRKLTFDDAVKIAGFIGVQLPGSVPNNSHSTFTVSGVPVRGVAMEHIWREGGLGPAGGSIAGLMDSEFPLDIQYGLLVDEQHQAPGVASEYVLCVPIAKLTRPIQKNDLLHCERTKSGLTLTVLRRVVQGSGKSAKLGPRTGNGRPSEAIAEYDVKGIVIGRTERFVI